MEIKIVCGAVSHIKDCETALSQSELGRKYFSRAGSAKAAVEEGIQKGEIHAALGHNQECVGFLWIIPKGSFHSFPYLHIIAVKEEYRGQGIGEEMMAYFEKICFEGNSKVFLVVADFNPDAKRFYERLGYQQVGILPSLYREGITEYLMMKVRKEQA